LHVLSLPPAFALSQDQTLKLDENLFRLITTFDEVPPHPCALWTWTRLASRPHPPLHGNGVDLKRVPPKSRPAATAPGSILGLIPRWKRPARTPPSTFLFLPIHLSNSPGSQRPHLPERAGEPSKPPPPTTDRRLVTVISEELRRRVIAPSGGAPCGGYIGDGPEPCQPRPEQIFSLPRNCG
jgi:hypothetical protein